MKKWRLKKNTPCLTAGKILYQDENSMYFYEGAVDDFSPHTFPSPTRSEWLEEVDERWRPDEGQIYWSVVYERSGKYEVSCDRWVDEELDRNYFETYNCFQTREQAEECAKLCLETRKKYMESLNYE